MFLINYNLSFVGGIAGWNGGTISRCSSSAEAQHRFVGGQWEPERLGGGGIGSLVGVNAAAGVIRESYSTGSINSSLGEQACDAYNQAYGVLAGYNLGLVENCYVNTDTTVYGGKYTGGFIGSNDGTVRYCWSSVAGYNAYRPSHLCIGDSTYNVTGVYYETSKAQSGTANRNGEAIMKTELTSGDALNGFDTSIWSFAAGEYPDLINNAR